VADRALHATTAGAPTGAPTASARVAAPPTPGGDGRVRRSRRSELWVCHLGVIPYREAMALQEGVRARRQAGDLPDVLLMLEHEPVYTRGRRSEPGELPMGEEWCRAQGIDVVATDRGGKLTYHGPGQLVGYPIMEIDDVLAYLRTMERAIVSALAEEGVTAGPREGLTGVWVEDRKIGSIGVHVARRVTMHGFAINVENDLQPFEWVVPCGLEGVRMTSLTRETGRGAGALRCFRRRMAHRFAEAHGRRQRLVAPHRVGAPAPASVPLGA
jgi:lipoyl(octanoyl) transferase